MLQVVVVTVVVNVECCMSCIMCIIIGKNLVGIRDGCLVH